MRDDIPDDATASAVTILVPAAQFGGGKGQYWKQHRINGLVKRAVVDGDCMTNLEQTDGQTIEDQIWDSLCADLRKYALDVPDSETAEHVRQHRFLDGLVSFARFKKSLSDSDLKEQKPTKKVMKADQTWDQIIIDLTLCVLKESAAELPFGFHFPVAATQWLFLLMYKRTRGGFFNPRLENLSENFLNTVFAADLAKVPNWFKPDQDEYRRTIKGWDDIFKAHAERIARVRHLYQKRRVGMFSFQLTLTGESFAFRHLLKQSISREVLMNYLGYIDQHAELFVSMPAELRRDPAETAPDENLVAVNMMDRAS